MPASNLTEVPPVLTPHPNSVPRAPTLYAIIAFKFIKGLALVLMALAFYAIPHADLKEQIARVFRDANLSASNNAEVSGWLNLITSENMRLAMLGAVFYGLFSWIEGTGLFMRATWAAWMTIVESALYVPVEMWHLAVGFSISMLIILLLNVGVVWYLYANRRRLFH